MLIQDAITGQLSVMTTLFLGQWYAGLILLLPLPFDRCRTVIVNLLDALVATVRLGLGVCFEPYFRVLEQLKVMRLAMSKGCTHDFLGSLVYGNLTLFGVSFLLA